MNREEVYQKYPEAIVWRQRMKTDPSCTKSKEFLDWAVSERGKAFMDDMFKTEPESPSFKSRWFRRLEKWAARRAKAR